MFRSQVFVRLSDNNRDQRQKHKSGLILLCRLQKNAGLKVADSFESETSVFPSTFYLIALQFPKVGCRLRCTRRSVCSHDSQEEPGGIKHDHWWGVFSASAGGKQAGLTQYARKNRNGGFHEGRCCC